MKKVGIFVDDFKVDRLKKELTKAGYINFAVYRYSASLFFFQVRVLEKEIGAINKILQQLELHFKRGN